MNLLNFFLGFSKQIKIGGRAKDLDMKKPSHKFVMIAFMSVVVLGQTGHAQEKKKREPWEKFSIGAGVLTAGLDSTYRVGAGVGVDLDFEDFLGLESSETFIQ